MILRCIWLLASLLPYVFADVKVVSPAAGSTITGTTIDISWEESNTDPPITSFASYAIFLCAGGNTESNYIQLYTLVATGDYKAGSSKAATFTSGLGANVENAYFLKFLSATTGGSIINFSDRFTLSSMTGVFPDTVQAGLKTVTGTTGPATIKDIATPQNNPNPAAAAPAGNAASFALPYTMQTGPIRYAPMPKIGQTKITAKGPSMQYPTSAYNIAHTFLGSADCVSTAVEGGVQTFATQENTAIAANQPTDTAMARFLNRWKD